MAPRSLSAIEGIDAGSVGSAGARRCRRRRRIARNSARKGCPPATGSRKTSSPFRRCGLGVSLSMARITAAGSRPARSASCSMLRPRLAPASTRRPAAASWRSKRWHRRRPIRHPLDIGTGTGILAIAAAKLLRRRVLASDIDAGSVAVARHNVVRNGVAQLVRVERASRLSQPRAAPTWLRPDLGEYPGAAAGASWPPISRAISPLVGERCCRDCCGGRKQSYWRRTRALGLALEGRIVIDGWSTLILRAGSASKLASAIARPHL